MLDKKRRYKKYNPPIIYLMPLILDSPNPPHMDITSHKLIRKIHSFKLTVLGSLDVSQNDLYPIVKHLDRAVLGHKVLS